MRMRVLLRGCWEIAKFWGVVGGMALLSGGLILGGSYALAQLAGV